MVVRLICAVVCSSVLLVAGCSGSSDGAAQPNTSEAKPTAGSLTFHWELMFTRPLVGGDHQISQHHLLGRVADLVDAGQVRSTATTVLQPINAEQLREAHRLVQTGRTIGKVVVSN